ncbi:MAG: ABC transporter ATP-binding protein [Acetobacteraceae bacterium]
MSEPPVFSLSNIVKIYESGDEKLRVLDGASITLQEGEIVALIAPSGTGKSTLLHIAGLLERPDAGQIAIAGRDVTRFSDAEHSTLRRDEIGFVYQFHHLLAEFTALENVVLPQRIGRVPASVARRNAADLLAQFGLSHRQDHLPGRLSGGEKQRVAIARALANHPKIILADEPTGNLDGKTSDLVFDNLLEVVRKARATALIVTHNETLARRMDRVIALKDGKLQTV